MDNNYDIICHRSLKQIEKGKKCAKKVEIIEKWLEEKRINISKKSNRYSFLIGLIWFLLFFTFDILSFVLMRNELSFWSWFNALLSQILIIIFISRNANSNYFSKNYINTYADDAWKKNA